MQPSIESLIAFRDAYVELKCTEVCAVIRLSNTEKLWHDFESSMASIVMKRLAKLEESAQFDVSVVARTINQLTREIESRL